jgi:hypothetical protein
MVNYHFYKKAILEACILWWKFVNSSEKFCLKWDLKRCPPINMLKALSGILTHFSSLNSIQPEMRMILSSLKTRLRLKTLTVNIGKKWRQCTKKEAMEVLDINITGPTRKQKKIFSELILQLFLQDYFESLESIKNSPQENIFQSIEYFETKV